MTNAQVETVKNFLALMHTDKLDIARIRACLADDARYQPIVPLSAPVRGADRICAELERQYALYKDCACEIINIASAGKTVFTERVERVKQRSDNSETVTHVAGVFDLDADNRIVWWREYWDALDIADQIGVSGDEMKAIMTTA